MNNNKYLCFPKMCIGRYNTYNMVGRSKNLYLRDKKILLNNENILAMVW